MKCGKIGHYAKWCKSTNISGKVKGQAAEMESQPNRGPGKINMNFKPDLMGIQPDANGWPQCSDPEVTELSSGSWFQIKGCESRENMGKD